MSSAGQQSETTARTAIFAFSTSNKELLPNLQSDLTPLIEDYLESESKLGVCPGDPDKSTLRLPYSSYKGGPYLDGLKKLSSEGINSNTIILADAEEENHKAGRNAIRLDGSFTQGGSAGDKIVVDPPVVDPPVLDAAAQIVQDAALHTAIKSVSLEDVQAALAAGADPKRGGR